MKLTYLSRMEMQIFVDEKPVIMTLLSMQEKLGVGDGQETEEWPYLFCWTHVFPPHNQARGCYHMFIDKG